ncbi:hypothetical protein NA78x_000385 [Anatilimnocola sp. NA78]|uniref:hypothetical protein n=1 Tax=Anatilimnocola sp. NA78 TaxID=3415683 RepID=UPI003CE4789D
MFEHLAKVTASTGVFPARRFLSFGTMTLTNTPAKWFVVKLAVSLVVPPTSSHASKQMAAAGSLATSGQFGRTLTTGRSLPALLPICSENRFHRHVYLDPAIA